MSDRGISAIKPGVGLPGPGAPALVTIMIPTYGQARIVGKAIESALAQDYPNLEVVVSDDASPDGTAAAVGPFTADPRLRYVRRPLNLGRTANYRSTLVEEAMGTYVLNLDGDDWLCDPTYVSAAMALISAHPDLMLVFARSRTFNDETNTFDEDRNNLSLPTICDGTDLFLRYSDGTVSIPHLTAIYRRDLAVELGFYQHDVIGSDSVAMLLLLPGRRIGFIDRVVGVWRRHERNATWISDVTSRQANFIVADLPSRSADAVQALDTKTLRDWQRKMSIRLAYQTLADNIADGRRVNAALLTMQMLRHRPRVTVAALMRLASYSTRWVRRSSRIDPHLDTARQEDGDSTSL